MAQDAPGIRAAGLAPTPEQIRCLHDLLPGDSLPELLERYEDLALISGNYFLCDLRNQTAIAALLQPLGGETALNIEDRYTFALSPTKCNDPLITVALLHLATCRADQCEARVDDVVHLPARPPTDSQSLQHLEIQHKLLVLYLWLS
jgi:ATP-dependent RNA helicase SUPV3L1/SUV3